ncbi:hypothetical protein ACE1ET_16725 [Saccharicrinis sp. FJH62]|uniref:hypothetical protein n=1 Tax=Saccharicrinis sp. FJH62 TaxID=3344657 RepID=UPI0035D411E3
MKSNILFTFVLITLLFSLSSLGSNRNKAEANDTAPVEELKANALTPKATYIQGELEVITMESVETHSVRVSAFPNPIKQNITLLTFGKNSEDLRFLLKGQDKTLLEKQIKNSKESIEIKDYEFETCYLSVYKSNEQIKKYKIIKH